MRKILQIQEVLQLVLVGITTVQQVFGAISSGRAKVEGVPDGATFAELEAAIEAAKAQAVAAGDEAAARIDGRVGGTK